jgi:hypothetical protein
MGTMEKAVLLSHMQTLLVQCVGWHMDYGSAIEMQPLIEVCGCS